MKAMRLHRPGRPLQLDDVAIPEPGRGEVLIRVAACGVCRTDLHIADGELPAHILPLIPGHEIVGTVVQCGAETEARVGALVGVPWLARTCGQCSYCLAGEENLCDHPTFTGYDVDGGYAEYAIAASEACIPLPQDQDPVHLAPLLCAGLIGYRAYRMAQPERNLGLFGFGAAAHILAQLAAQDGIAVHAVTRPGDAATQAFASSLGAVWTGSADEAPPGDLDAAIIFASDGSLVPKALRAVRKGGRVICAGIHMSDLPGFPYSLLWGERHLRSVANLTRRDGTDLFTRLAGLPLKTRITTFPLTEANQALSRLRSGDLVGAAVLVCG